MKLLVGLVFAMYFNAVIAAPPHQALQKLPKVIQRLLPNRNRACFQGYLILAQAVVLLHHKGNKVNHRLLRRKRRKAVLCPG